MWRRPAHQMLAALRAGEVSAEELVRQCLARIEAVNPGLNAVVECDPEAALAEARRVDDGTVRGPLAGLPFTAKLDYDVAGQATSEGSVLLRDAIAAADGPVISRMRAAGAVLLGRTNEPDFGALFHTESSLYGLTRNPWRLDVSAGGSSGGEGAAVASGMSPLGLGSDFGGSIRTPASFTGVVGFKPSFGRYPNHRQSRPEPTVQSQLFTSRGPLARSVRDVPLVDAVLRGADPRDPWSGPVADRPARRGRIGLVHAPTDLEPAPAVAAALEAAADALRATGHQVEETKLEGWPELAATYAEIALADFGGDPSIWPTLPDVAQRFLQHVRASREGVVSDLGGALARRHRLAVEFNAFHERYDVLLMPTWCELPFPATALDSLAGLESALIASRHLCVFNLLGLPTLSVPAAVAEGLPVGVQLSSLRHQDATVLAAGIDLESQLGVFTPVMSPTAE